MKYFLVISLLLFSTSCIKKHDVSFTGAVTGVKNGVFIVSNTDDSTVYGENIKDGKFSITNRPLRYIGYYLIHITNNDSTKTLPPFEVYLEPGAYHVEADNNKLYKYPKIISPSDIQAQLSAYYTLYDKLYDEKFELSKKLNEELQTKGSSLSTEAHNALNNRAIQADVDFNNLPFLALSEYAKNSPQSDVTAHLMAKQNYEADPVGFYKLFKTFSKASQNSDDGKELGNKLGKLAKLVNGAKAPAIYGKTLDGKSFDQSTIKSKVILIDFWRASNEISRRNHAAMIDFLQTTKGTKKFDIVSVSIDTKVDWWVTAINEDHTTWTQVTDLKGDVSPNAENWGITKIPTYYLLNDKWEIIDRDFNIDRLDFEVNDYLNHHH